MEPSTTSGTVGLRIFDNTLATNDGVFGNNFEDLYVEGNNVGIQISASVGSGGGIKRNMFNGMVEANNTDLSLGTNIVRDNTFVNITDSYFDNPITSFQAPFRIATTTGTRALNVAGDVGLSGNLYLSSLISQNCLGTNSSGQVGAGSCSGNSNWTFNTGGNYLTPATSTSGISVNGTSTLATTTISNAILTTPKIKGTGAGIATLEYQNSSNNRTITFPDIGADYSVVGTAGNQSIGGSKTFTFATRFSSPDSVLLNKILSIDNINTYIKFNNPDEIDIVAGSSSALTITNGITSDLVHVKPGWNLTVSSPGNTSASVAVLGGTQTFQGAKTFSATTTMATTSVLGNLQVNSTSGNVPLFLVSSSTDEYFKISSSSVGTRVGIGTSTPSYTLTVAGTAAITGMPTATGQNAVCVRTNGTFELVNAGANSCTGSSIRFKENVLTLPKGEALDIIDKLRVVSFDYKEGYYDTTDAPHAVGLIAEEVERVDTRLVDYGTDGKPASLYFERITGLLVQAVQELKEGIPAAKRSAEENWQWLAIALLGAGLVYQQVQIKRLRK